MSVARRAGYGMFLLALGFCQLSCASTSGTCDGEAVGDRKTRADCSAPYFQPVPGCVKDVDCTKFNDVASCQAASCAVSAQSTCSNAFAPCLIDGGTVPEDDASCALTTGCHWNTLCVTATHCAGLHSLEACTAVPYCDWEPNTAL